jgi:hypothetical protein
MAPAGKANNWTKVQEECRAKNGVLEPFQGAGVTERLQRIAYPLEERACRSS